MGKVVQAMFMMAMVVFSLWVLLKPEDRRSLPVEFAPATDSDVEWAVARGYDCHWHAGQYSCRR